MGRETRSSRRIRLLLVSIPALLLAACAENAPLDSLDPAGPAARRIDGLFRPVFWVAVAIFAVVSAGIIAAIVLFRDRPDRADPKQVHGNTTLEVVWTVIPVIILASLVVPTVRTVMDLTSCSSDAVRVEVIGHQWWFEYFYAEADIATANVLVIPAGRQVCLELTSEDVIHNFWVPRLNGKRYVIPGQQTELTLEADEPGEYWGQCGEFCGLSHALMRARVVALPEDQYAAWVASQQSEAVEPAAGSRAEDGKNVFLNGGCTQCHVIRGVWTDVARQPPAPDLTHFASRHVFAGAALETDRANLQRWLANPPAVKPGSLMPNLRLTADDIDALIAYLETLE